MPSLRLSRTDMDHYETLLLTANADTCPTLDLHGLDAHSAVHELDYFIHQQLFRQEEVVRILHGRGRGTLKRAVHTWLRDHSEDISYFREALNSQQDSLTLAILRI